MMHLRLGGSFSVTEIFNVPDDYPMVETDQGDLLQPGWYHWILQPCGTPDTYPTGPFEDKHEAMVDSKYAGGGEPTEDEKD